MTRNDRRAAARLLATCAVAAVVLTGCGSSPIRAGAAAVVGDSRISTEELAQDVDEGLADPGAAQLAADRPSYQRDVLSRRISADLVDVAAQRRGVSVTQGQVDAEYAALEQSVGGPEELASQAAAAGLPMDRVRDLARTRALSTALGDALTADLPVTADQLQQAYQAALDTYDQVRVAQIQLPTAAEAQALLPQARGLSDEGFAELARTRSVDEASKARGGDLGLAPRSAVGNGVEAYATAVLGAQVGDTLAVAAPEAGFVVRVLERRTTTLEQATPELRRTVLDQERQAALQQELTETARSLNITINPRFGAWDPATLTVVAAQPTGNRELSSPEAPAGGAEAPAEDLPIAPEQPEQPEQPEPVEPEPVQPEPEQSQPVQPEQSPAGQ
ncbi:MAG TPA: SurA N-terminal domain-containing protein [Mycobacteriales bacterium]|nr:SurA N-terminal domain-containing protein [Mycobacteriales bacterium]